MSRFLDGTGTRRGPKRKVRECLVCCEDTLDPVVCAAHSSESSYCNTCIAKMWVSSGRQPPKCQVCNKEACAPQICNALLMHDTKHGTSYMAQYQKHQTFLHGDNELPIDGLLKRMCVCHDPPCKGRLSANQEWITFKPTLKVKKTLWHPSQTRYIQIPDTSARHRPICAHCLAPAPTVNHNLNEPCILCQLRTDQALEYKTLHHYINPLAGAKGSWCMPKRLHQVSQHDLLRHLWFILEDQDLFMRCPIDGTVLEHGTACHELTCPTCKLVKMCFCCGRVEVVGVEGAMIDHFEAADSMCMRYPDQYTWTLYKTGAEPHVITCPCTEACTNLSGRCEQKEHALWRKFYKSYRRMRWLVSYIKEMPFHIAFMLFRMAMDHPTVVNSPFKPQFFDVAENFNFSD